MTEEQGKDCVQDDECVVRYVKPKQVHDDGAVDLEAFVLRPADEDDGLSLSRPVKFSGGIEERLKEIARCLHMKVTRKRPFRMFLCPRLDRAPAWSESQP